MANARSCVICKGKGQTMRQLDTLPPRPYAVQCEHCEGTGLEPDLAEQMAWVCQLCGYGNLDRDMVLAHLDVDHEDDHSDPEDEDD